MGSGQSDGHRRHRFYIVLRLRGAVSYLLGSQPRGV